MVVERCHTASEVLGRKLVERLMRSKAHKGRALVDGTTVNPVGPRNLVGNLSLSIVFYSMDRAADFCAEMHRFSSPSHLDIVGGLDVAICWRPLLISSQSPAWSLLRPSSVLQDMVRNRRHCLHVVTHGLLYLDRNSIAPTPRAVRKPPSTRVLG